MLKIENIEEHGIQHAIRAMRNPMDSWEKSDTTADNYGVRIGKNDLRLMKTLLASGPEHRTYLRQIQVWFDVTAPMYWHKECDRYTVGRSQVSCSTMHKLGSRMLTLEDFAHNADSMYILQEIIKDLNGLILDWQETKSMDIWLAIVQILPSAYLQKRTINQSLECVLKQINERKNHKLSEWRDYCEFMHQNTLLKDLIVL